MEPTLVFTRFANAVSRVAGRPLAFVICITLVLAWAVCGPMFGFSDTWQLVINTSTTIITFLMVFLIQNTQNRDNAALQAKLDELIRVTNAKNGFIGIEKLTDKELEKILDEFESDGKATSLGRKSEIIDRKAKQVRAEMNADDRKKARSSTLPSRAKPRASARKRA